MSLVTSVARRLTPRVGSIAPGPNAAVMNRALDRAVHGFGPLTGAVASAQSHLDPAALATLRDGGSLPDHEVQDAVAAVVSTHVRLAATQGFLTNLGGLAAMAVGAPANLAGLALVQLRMIAAIAHLGGHDLDDPAVRSAVLVCLLGQDGVDDLVAAKKLPGRPRDLAGTATGTAAGTTAGTTAGTVSTVDRLVPTAVTNDLVARITGRRLATTVGRRVPVLGGAVGALTDSHGTRAIGRYAARELVG